VFFISVPSASLFTSDGAVPPARSKSGYVAILAIRKKKPFATLVDFASSVASVLPWSRG
jgi:hypothetical protein